MPHNAKSITRISTTGFSPASAMPTAAPMMLASEIGVSMIRSGPKRVASGWPSSMYWPNTPPRPRSSPSATMRGSASIAVASAAAAACA